MPLSSQPLPPIGFGGVTPKLAIYVANRPQFDEYPALDELRALVPGELEHIVANTSNYWRKLFNVYAKFLFELGQYGAFSQAEACSSWQAYRDTALLQPGCEAALLFSAPQLALRSKALEGSVVQIIAGKTYAAELGFGVDANDDALRLQWLDAHFAINRQSRVIVCPYLDYRQLSNERISRLVAYLYQFWGEDLGFTAVPKEVRS